MTRRFRKFILSMDMTLKSKQRSQRVSYGQTGFSATSSDEDVVPHADEPLTDEEWTANYEKEREADDELERKLKDRFHGTVEVSEWYVRWQHLFALITK